MTATRVSLVLALLTLEPLNAASFVVGPEKPLATIDFAAAPGPQRPEAVASDGTNFLVLWTDGFMGSGPYASLVNAAGALISVHRVSTSNARSISVVWTGSNYLATWTDDTAHAVEAASISRDGTVQEPTRVVDGARVTFARALAWNGHLAMLAAADENRNLFAAVLDADGAILRTVQLPQTQLAAPDVHIASSDDEFALFWFAGEPRLLSTPPPPPQPIPLVAVRLSGAGAIRDTAPIVITKVLPGAEFGVAGNRDGYALALETTSSATQARITRLLLPRDTFAPSPVSSIDAPNTFDVNILWTGQQFIAYWMAYTSASASLMTAPYDRDKVTVVLTENSIAVDPLLASNQQNVLAAWMGGANNAISFGGGDVLGTLLSADAAAAIGPQFVIGVGPMPQTAPRIASSPNGSLIVWKEQRDDSSSDLVAERVTRTGALIDGAPIVIAQNVSGGVVASVRDSFIVAWSQPEGNGYAVYSRRVSAGGAVSEPRRIGAGGGAVVAANGSVVLVAFNTGNDIVGVRVAATGDVLDSVPFTIKNGYGFLVSAASNGSDFLVVWNEGSDWWQFPSPDRIDVYAARVFATGGADATPIAVATGPGNQRGGVAASHGGDYLIVYTVDNGCCSNDTRLLTKRLLSNGQLAAGTASDDGAPIAENVRDASITSTATGYAIAGEFVDGDTADLRIIMTDDAGNAGDRVIVGAQQPQGVAVFMTPAIANVDSMLRLTYDRTATDGELTATRVFFKDIAVAPLRQRAARR